MFSTPFLPGLTHDNAQRWFRGRDSYRPSREPIRTKEFTVDRIERTAAKRFVEEHHYSGSFVYEIASFGLWQKSGQQPARLVGVASFATPTNPNSIQRWTGLPSFRDGAELGRFVLLDDVAGNGETFFLARALRQLKEARPELKVILSYSDPVPRRNLLTNELGFRGHWGSVYQSSNAIYAGRSSCKTLLLSPSGEAIPNRILTKLRNGEGGANYAQARLEELTGLRRGTESADAFISRALASPSIRQVRHPGNHLYLFPLAGDRREKSAIMGLPAMAAHQARALPFPKRIDQAA